MTDTTPGSGRTAFRHDGGDVGVLLIHGFTGTPGSLHAWADHLVTQGYTVRLPLLPGHGTCWRDANRTTFDDWLGTVTAALQELRGRCRAVVVGGLSTGGTLALRLAQLYPDSIDGIMPVNPQLMTRHKLARLLPLLQLFLPVFSGVSGDVAKPGVVEPGYNRLPVKAMYSLSKAWLVVRADLPKVTVPTLLMHSRADHIVEPENSRIVLDEISSTDVTELVLERSYHVATMDYDAELIFAASTEFIEKITVSVS